jgi:hypothetical protein
MALAGTSPLTGYRTGGWGGNQLGAARDGNWRSRLDIGHGDAPIRVVVASVRRPPARPVLLDDVRSPVEDQWRRERTKAMGKFRMVQLRALEGRRVSLALADGSRIDDGQLVAAGRSRRTIWVFSNGADTFLPLHEVIDVWEPEP